MKKSILSLASTILAAVMLLGLGVGSSHAQNSIKCLTATRRQSGNSDRAEGSPDCRPGGFYR
jgi:hypothetical protein